MSNFSDDYLESLNITLCNNFNLIADAFDLEVLDYRKNKSFACPIHNGDNPTGLTIYPNDPPYGCWQCNTYHCHKYFPRNMIGFIWGVLSANNGWSKEKPHNKVHFFEAIAFCKKIVGNVKVDKICLRNKIKAEAEKEKESLGHFTRNEIRERLIIPSPYFIKLGFSPEILDYYDVGDPKNPKKEMMDRAIVPIYDENSLYIGCQGRHFSDSVKPKWKNSEGLPVETVLYNYNDAKKHIRQSKTVILVESPKSVWRLSEAGIRNCVAILGTFKGGQRILLEMSGANRIISAMDNDIPGQEHHESIVKSCKRIFNVTQAIYGERLDGNDPANLSIEEVKNVFSPFGQDGKRERHIAF